MCGAAVEWPQMRILGSSIICDAVRCSARHHDETRALDGMEKTLLARVPQRGCLCRRV